MVTAKSVTSLVLAAKVFVMTAHDYNYAVFSLENEKDKFTGFQVHPLHAGRSALDFPLEDLASSKTVHLRDLWSDRLLIVEFGSYT